MIMIGFIRVIVMRLRVWGWCFFFSFPEFSHTVPLVRTLGGSWFLKIQKLGQNRLVICYFFVE